MNSNQFQYLFVLLLCGETFFDKAKYFDICNTFFSHYRNNPFQDGVRSVTKR